MNVVQLQRIDENLQRLRLFKSRERFEALLQHAAVEEFSYADFLDRVLDHAVTVNIRENSYRPKEKLKSGLVRAEEPSDIT